MINKKEIPNYVKGLVKENSNITSGRKNFIEHHLRIIETLRLIKKYFKFKSK